MQTIDPKTLGACRQCQGVLCIRPDRIACTQCGMPLEETIVKATPGKPPAAAKIDVKPASEAATNQPQQQAINGTKQEPRRDNHKGK